MRIETVLTEYFRKNHRIRCEHTRDQYRFAVNDLAKAIESDPCVSDLTDDSLCAMISHMQSRGLAPKTINERAGRIRALWRWLADRGRVSTRPTIGNIPEPKRIPLAWSHEELSALFAACDEWVVDYEGVSGSRWWRSLHHVAWDTGERISAMLDCRWDWVSGEWLAIPAESRKGKTSDRVYKLAPDTRRCLASMRSPDRELIWPWPLSRSSLWCHYRRLRKIAGLSLDRRSAFHRIRRSVATHAEAAGGNATELLDHSDRRLTKESYLDPRFLQGSHAVDYLFRPAG